MLTLTPQVLLGVWVTTLARVFAYNLGLRLPIFPSDAIYSETARPRDAAAALAQLEVRTSHSWTRIRKLAWIARPLTDRDGVAAWCKLHFSATHTTAELFQPVIAPAVAATATAHRMFEIRPTNGHATNGRYAN